MPSNRTLKWIAFILGALLLLLIVDGALSWLLNCYRPTLECRFDQGPLTWLLRTFDHHNGAVIAFFTIVLAGSTIGLWNATYRLWEAGERQLRITERAHIAVFGLGVEPFAADSVAHLSVTNVGRLPAQHVAWFIAWTISCNGKLADFPISGPFYGGTNVIPPGTEMRRSKDCKNIDEMLLWRFQDKEKPPVFFYVWGEIRYSDGFGDEKFTKFCHRYDYRGLRLIKDGGPFDGQKKLIADSVRSHQFGNDAD